MNHRAQSLVALLCVAVSLLSGGCSTTKHVPDGAYLLDKVDIKVEGDKSAASSVELINYLRQQPNHKVLGFWKLQLGTYNLSGEDSTKWFNKWMRRMGQAPVIYRNDLTEASARQLRLALVNRGYLETEVTVDTVMLDEKKKASVTYHVKTGEPHVITSVDYIIPDTAIASIVLAGTEKSELKPGVKFNRDNLEAERTLITRRLRDRGYYDFNKENITFIADTAENSRLVNLTMVIRDGREKLSVSLPGELEKQDSIYSRYRLRNVTFVTESNVGTRVSDLSKLHLDTVRYGDISVLYGPDRFLKPSILEEKCYLMPGHIYSTSAVDRTYESLTRLGILRSVNIELVPAGEADGEKLLDAYILLSRNKKQTITFDVEGTNSEGDLGFGLGATYQHRNLAHGSQLLTTRLRMNYESLSGKFSNLINNRYTEFAGEVGITFPRFEFPFSSRAMQRRLNVATEFAVSLNYQERPEYTRIISGAAWKYKWYNRTNTKRHEFDLLDINYVYLPERTNNFLDSVAPDNPLLRYAYEDHLIMSMGYRYYKTNKRIASTVLRNTSLQPTVYTLRASIETAGNLLWLGEKVFKGHRQDGVYKVFGTPFSQYVKGEIDYSLTRNISRRHSFAFHVGGGVGYPYGNSEAIPFEKRFYAGGANGVRGWSVRTLGPGSYNSHNSVSYFINQCGDIRLDLSVEYRAKLFWVFEGALFVDAGNVWTIHAYENQPGGMFHFNTFWKEIAMAYGAGLRMDFNYFLLRLDLGVKAYNPAQGQERWPLIHPRWGRDTAFHFSVGYPF